MLFNQGFQFPQIGMQTGAGAELPGTLPIPLAMWDDFFEGADTAGGNTIFPYELTATGTAIASNSWVASILDSGGVYTLQSGSAANDEMYVRSRGVQFLLPQKPVSYFARVRTGGSTATHYTVWGLWRRSVSAVAITQAEGIGFRLYNGFIQIGARNDTNTVAWANVAPMAASTFYVLAIITDGVKHQFYVDGVKVGEISLDCLKTSGASTGGVYSMGLACGTTATSPTAVSRCGVDYWGFSAVR